MMSPTTPGQMSETQQPTMLPQTIQTSQCEPVAQVSAYQMDARTQLLPASSPTQTSAGVSSAVATGTSVAVAMQLQVSVPTGSAPGQEIHFTAPDGRTMSAAVPEGVTPGSVLTVQYPINNQPTERVVQPEPMTMQPPPQIRSGGQWDGQAVVMWRMYIAGWILMFLAPVIGIILWIVCASLYYCKSQGHRHRHTKQRAPAMAALITVSVIAVIAFLSMLGGLVVFLECGDQLQHCPGLEAQARKTDQHMQKLDDRLQSYFGGKSSRFRGSNKKFASDLPDLQEHQQTWSGYYKTFASDLPHLQEHQHEVEMKPPEMPGTLHRVILGPGVQESELIIE